MSDLPSRGTVGAKPANQRFPAFRRCVQFRHHVLQLPEPLADHDKHAPFYTVLRALASFGVFVLFFFFFDRSSRLPWACHNRWQCRAHVPGFSPEIRRTVCESPGSVTVSRRMGLSRFQCVSLEPYGPSPHPIT